ncbi:MAG: hypothetical protein OEY18_08815 [Candidatus Aminicenantes bacterium]|jgi:hypothetical protein|nr:hypothetical protein [Candidatus Aminicenantes bacterium]MDH5384794.1 hypothetical protein [Candidatus Aminicenantes bacterium]MDH5742231.1 hypothetical protein [Candidatus Aminicenantes bacterium]
MKKIIQLQMIAALLLFMAPVLFPKDNGDNYYVKAFRFDTTPKIDGKLENPIWEEGVVLDNVIGDDGITVYLDTF